MDKFDTAMAERWKADMGGILLYVHIENVIIIDLKYILLSESMRSCATYGFWKSPAMTGCTVVLPRSSPVCQLGRNSKNRVHTGAHRCNSIADTRISHGPVNYSSKLQFEVLFPFFVHAVKQIP
jgi:hypothetical protein